MELKPCRDCATPVSAGARGCQRCARNLEAERMLARIFWGALLTVLLAVGVAVMLLAHARR